jgi:O-antigen/teichoic acid export membrane protein
VAFPAFSKIQDQPERINAYILKAQKLSLLITIPIFWGLASVVDLIIPIMLGEKWSAAVMPTMIILLVMPLRFSEELFNPAFKSQRRIKHIIYNVCIMAGFLIIGILIGAQYGAIGLACAWAVCFPIAYLWIVVRNSAILNIHYTAILKLFISPLISGAAMIFVIFTFKYYFQDISLLNLTGQIILGASSFLGTLFLLDKTLINELVALVKRNH